MLAANSSWKGMSDLSKYEKARELKKHIGKIRTDYMKGEQGTPPMACFFRRHVAKIPQGRSVFSSTWRSFTPRCGDPTRAFCFEPPLFVLRVAPQGRYMCNPCFVFAPGAQDGMRSSDAEAQQKSVAVYLIDRLALRVGNEKNTDEEADT
eukprot:scaffold31216_cov79-Isochrysis_galbana.AAC.1